VSANPIAYAFDADTHCPSCTTARFGVEPGRSWPPEDARDSEGDSIGAIFPWDEWHEPADNGRFTLTCATCSGVIDSCDHGPVREQEAGDPGDECDCASCRAASKFTVGGAR
jgi:hypothetical protein